MGQPKVKKQSSKKNYIDMVNADWTKNFSGRLKEFKTWAQVKSPKTIQSALSYTLDWLTPELLGTGFRLFEVSDFEIKAYVPAVKANFDSQFEIHQGLVTNAALELARVFIQRQVPDQFFQIGGSEFTLIKKNKWKSDLNLVLKISEAHLDEFFVQTQKNRRATIEFEILIGPTQRQHEKPKGQDRIDLKLHIETTELIS